jgi:two-component system sensor histidine kinase GlrK
VVGVVRGVSLYRPKSILRLILGGFVVVTVPLILALITAAVYVDRLTKHGQRSVVDAVNATQSSLMLLEHITAMERNARQYQVLGDHALLDVYQSQHGQFQRAVGELRRVDLSPRQHELVDELVYQEQRIYDQLSTASPTAPAVGTAIGGFPTLNAEARSVLAESSHLIGENVGEIESLAAHAQQLLIWQTLGLIPAVLVFSVIFIVLIIRPLRQIEHSVNRLGNGHFNEAIQVKGPDDLQELGQRLEWMRRRLLEVESQKMMFLRHISHELKTPLTTIREGTELLNDQIVGSLNTEQMEIAAMLKQNSVQLQRLIEDLLNFSSLQTTGQLVHREQVQLDRLILDQILTHKLAAKSKSVTIEDTLVSLSLSGDREKLRIIVDNLLSNAIKYSPPGGRVKISLKTNGDDVVLDVQDEGPGVLPGERQKIFEAFYQGQLPPRSHVKGSGLGLFIAREFITLHHGTIELIDEPVGAHFRVVLPRRDDVA